MTQEKSKGKTPKVEIKEITITIEDERKKGRKAAKNQKKKHSNGYLFFFGVCLFIAFISFILFVIGAITKNHSLLFLSTITLGIFGFASIFMALNDVPVFPRRDYFD